MGKFKKIVQKKDHICSSATSCTIYSCPHREPHMFQPLICVIDRCGFRNLTVTCAKIEKVKKESIS